LEIYLADKAPNWGKQFVDACILGPILDEETEELTDPDCWDAFSHFCAMFWKVFFALVPPAQYGGGYPSFVASLTMIGIVTYIVGDVALAFGCSVGLKESVTAITFVALGTSLPDTFASMTAARESEFADSAIGNITGSNSVNVFLGQGIPWLMGSVYWTSTLKKTYEVPAGTLSFQVAVFLVVAIICFIVLIARRVILGGELGGNYGTKYASGCFLYFLWFLYIILSSL
jgi:solute carrier family 8 (sodium/calcium exchanger)